MTEIYVVRHGQAAFGSDDYDRLTEQGWQQARRLGEYFRDIGLAFGSVYTGLMRRHHETLEGIAQTTELPPPNGLAGLNEYDFHELVARYLSLVQREIDRTDSRTFYRTLREALLAWERGELTATETWLEFESRVTATLNTLSAAAGPVLVVTSGGAASAILRRVLGVDIATMVNLNLQAMNTGISRYFCKGERVSLNSFNAVPHLEAPAYRQLISYT